MKSKSSPSAPLNLCPPTGVTGTTLPGSDSAYYAKVGGLWTIYSPLTHGKRHVLGEYSHKEHCESAFEAMFPPPASPVASVEVPANAPQAVSIDEKLDAIRSLASLRNEDGDFRFPSELSCYKIQQMALELKHACAAERSAEKSRIKALETFVSRLADGGHGASQKIARLSAELIWSLPEIASDTSHAAKDAKIKALEEALDGLLDAIHYDAVSFPSSPKAVSTARAALTLPCAPQES